MTLPASIASGGAAVQPGRDRVGGHPHRTRRVAALACVAGWLAAGVFAGCARANDAGIQAYLEAAERAHAEADALLGVRQADAALDVLGRALAAKPPAALDPRDASLIERELAFRYADVAVGAGESVRAATVVTRALEDRPRTAGAMDVLDANLLAARAKAYERLGRDREAAADYHLALEIHEALLHRALGDDLRGGTRP